MWIHGDQPRSTNSSTFSWPFVHTQTFICCPVSSLAFLSHPTTNPDTSFHQKALAKNSQSGINYLLSALFLGLPSIQVDELRRMQRGAPDRRSQANVSSAQMGEMVSQIYLEVEMCIDGAPPQGGAQHRWFRRRRNS